MLEQKNVLALAFVGDAYHSLRVRTGLVASGDEKVAKLHQIAANVVCAKAQAQTFNRIKDKLTQTEADIANRARNAKHHTMPKNCSPAEYRDATALEALIGFWFLSDNEQRYNEVME